LAQAGCKPGVDLYGDDAVRDSGKSGGQSARAGAEVHDDVVTLDLRSANQLRCKLATAEKVLAGAAS
jgi:hypothetical protein